MPFNHLHGHSFASNWQQPDALSSPEEIVKRAKEIGLTSICITDHGTAINMPALAKAAKAHGIKPIYGSELYVCEDPSARPEKGERRRDYVHVVALAMNWEGVIEIFGLLSQANHPSQFYYRPRNSFAQLLTTKNVVFLTACGGGILSHENHIAILTQFRDTLGPDRIYLEIQPHVDERQAAINKAAINAASVLGLKLVATQDFHYALPGDTTAHEVLLAIGTRSLWSDPERFRYPVEDLYIKSHAEMVSAFMRHVDLGNLTIEQVAEAINTTQVIADRLNVEWKKIPISLPDMGPDPDKQVIRICLEELKRRGLSGKPEYLQRVIYEIEALQLSGFISYFLILRDIIVWARKNGIMVGPGRGSSGGSLVCYLMDIVQIDPIVHGLLFERFFRPGRIDLPDIDTDFEDERRDDVLTYIRKKYGDEYVAGVMSYTMMGAKSAIKDVARVFGVPHKDVNDATAPVPNELDDSGVFEAETVRPLLDRYPHVEQYARAMYGRMRGTGQHAAGVVIAGTPISQHGAVHYKDDRAIVCWDKNVIENMGLMKLDVLGLRTLSILRHAAETVARSGSAPIVFQDIPLDDAATFALFQRGETTGVFQFESRGMRDLLKSLKIDRFSVIADANALYRPGPMDLIPSYVAAQTGRSPIWYDDPLLEPILKDTFGVMVYQEQLMRVLIEVGGFNYADTDTVRKAVAKSMGHDEVNKWKDQFLSGAIAKGTNPEAAKKVFDNLVKFGKYGFNKSHACEYSLIAYWCAWMKVNHPAEFLAAHISNSDEAQTTMAVEDARKAGIEVLMPDINFSDAKRFVVLTKRKIQAPLTAIKGVGEKAAEIIVGAREGKLDPSGLGVFDTREQKAGTVVYDPKYVQDTKFSDQTNFMNRIYKRIVNTKVQGLLRDVGAIPWDMPTPEDLFMNRKTYLGAIYRESASVSESDFLVWDGEGQEAVRPILMEAASTAASLKIPHVFPMAGSKPRVMIVFEKPEWKDEKKNQLGNGDGFNRLRLMFREALGWDGRSLYLTSFYKMAKPPVGYEPYDEQSARLLESEIQLLKPPLIIACGARPIQYFVGKDAKVMENHSRVVGWRKIPVLCAMNPVSVVFKGVIDQDKLDKFRLLSGALKEIYGR